MNLFTSTTVRVEWIRDKLAIPYRDFPFLPEGLESKCLRGRSCVMDVYLQEDATEGPNIARPTNDALSESLLLQRFALRGGG